jgi:hypothetical protein
VFGAALAVLAMSALLAVRADVPLAPGSELEHWRYVRWALSAAYGQGPGLDAEVPAGLPEEPILLAPRPSLGATPRPLWSSLEDPGLFSRLVEGDPGAPRGDIRAVYLTGSSAADPAFMEHVLSLVESSQLNALVIDVKDNSGHTTYRSAVPEVLAIGASGSTIADLGLLLRQCEERGVYTIGRLVVFADPCLARARPDLAVQNLSGGVWRDQTGHGWTNPYAEEVWRYNLAIAREVASLGCREVQFDYVRFPSDGRLDLIHYPIKTNERPSDVIEAFLRRARLDLAPYGAFVAADVFGLVTSAVDDMNIGQVFEKIARQVDFVCPMMYPSHYRSGNYGLPDPDAEPYKTIFTGLVHGLRRLAGSQAVIRPWLQDFSWRHHYGPDQVRAEINAAQDLGVSGYMLWNPRNVYTEDAVR